MGSSDNDVPVPVPAVPVNDPPFSIRNYVFAARDKNISHNWPFPEKYLQTCMIHGVSKVLPPFDSHKSVKNIVHRREENSNCLRDEKSHIVSVRKNCVGLGRGKEVVEVNYNVSTLNTNPQPNEEMIEQCLTAVASSSKRLNFNGREENLIYVKDVRSDTASVQKTCVDRECEEVMIEVNGNVSTLNSNPRSSIEEEEKSSCVEDMILDIGSVQKNCIGLDREEEIIEGNSNVGISNLTLRSNEEENSDCVNDEKSDIGSVQNNCVGRDREEEIIEVDDSVSTSNSNPRSNIEENSCGVNDMKSDIGSVQKICVGLNRREEIIEVNGDISRTSNSNPKSNEEENSDCVDTGEVTHVGLDCKEIIEVNGNVSTSNSNPRSYIEENFGCVKDMKSDIGSIQKYRVGLNRREEMSEVNGVVSATSNSNPKSNKDENSDCIKEDNSDTGAVTCVGLDCREIIEANGNAGTSDSNPRSNEEGNSNCVKDDKSDTGAINFVAIDHEEEIIEVNGITSNSNPRSDEEEKSDVDSIQKNCDGFNREEEIIEVNSNVSTASNSNPKSSEEMDEQCLKAAASCSKRLNSKRKKRKRKAKKRLVADVVADAKPYTLEELDKINGSNWAIDQHVIYRRVTSRTHGDEVNGTKETTAISDIRETKSAERFRKTRQHGKDNNTAENDSSVVEKMPALVIKFKLRKPHSPKVEVNTPIKNDSKSKSVVTKSQVKHSLPSVSGVSTVIRIKRRGNS